MEMTREIRRAAVCGVFMLLATCLMGTILALPKPVSEQPAVLPVVSGRVEPATEEKSLTGFMVRGEDGVIAVYSAADGEPYMTTEISLAALRTADAEKLREGIYVEDAGELSQLLEDFGS